MQELALLSPHLYIRSTAHLRHLSRTYPRYTLSKMKQLIGAWKLIFINGTDVNSPTSEYGPNPLGLIQFSSEGYMNAIITDRMS
jgi:hypothetical protein